MKKKKEKTFFDKIKLDFKKITLGAIILNILFLIFGVIIYMNPYMTLNAVGVFIGIYFMVFGLFHLYEYFMRSVSPLYKNKIFMGILSIILGIFIIFNPFKIVKILTFTLGLYLIVVALEKLYETIKLKKCGYDGWSICLVTSVLLLIFGVFVAINPMVSMDIVQVTGIFIILSSILEISNLFMIYGKAKEIGKLVKKVK